MTLYAAAVGFLLTATVAPHAEGAGYKTSRPGLSIYLRVGGPYIRELRLSSDIRCADRQQAPPTRIIDPGFDVPVSRVTGRFAWRSYDASDEASTDIRFRGTVYRNATRGRFFFRNRLDALGISSRCWSGRSYADPWVGFVAPRATSQPKYCPRGDASGFDARRVIGLVLADARTVASRHGCKVRVARRDGVSLPVTEDYRPNRINVNVRDGRVVQTMWIG